MPYALSDAQAYAQEVVNILSPHCIRVEVAGSVRRKCPNPSDIELVSIPKPECLIDLRGIVNSRWGQPKIGAFPSRYTQIRSLLSLDLFWCSRETFGLNYFIRTGPAGYVKRALAHWKRITNGGYSDEAVLWKPDGKGSFEKVETFTEEDVFKVLGAPVIQPEFRYDTVEEQRHHQRQRRNESSH